MIYTEGGLCRGGAFCPSAAGGGLKWIKSVPARRRLFTVSSLFTARGAPPPASASSASAGGAPNRSKGCVSFVTRAGDKPIQFPHPPTQLNTTTQRGHEVSAHPLAQQYVVDPPRLEVRQVPVVGGGIRRGERALKLPAAGKLRLGFLREGTGGYAPRWRLRVVLGNVVALPSGMTRAWTQQNEHARNR